MSKRDIQRSATRGILLFSILALVLYRFLGKVAIPYGVVCAVGVVCCIYALLVASRIGH